MHFSVTQNHKCYIKMEKCVFIRVVYFNENHPGCKSYFSFENQIRQVIDKEQTSKRICKVKFFRE